MIIEKTIRYEDTIENIAFFATENGFRGDTKSEEELNQFINNFFDSLIKEKMTTPVKLVVRRMAQAQVEAQVKAKVDEVLLRLTIE